MFLDFPEVPSVDLYERMVDESKEQAKQLEKKYADMMRSNNVE